MHEVQRTGHSHRNSGKDLAVCIALGIAMGAATIPLSPFLARKGEEIISEGHPQTPGKGASPLCTPHISAAC